MPVLRDIDMFLASREATFIVGPSGCAGKSTSGSILLGHYTLGFGKGDWCSSTNKVCDIYLDAIWFRRHVADVTQLEGPAGVGAQVFNGSTIHWNVTIGAVGSGRPFEDMTRAEGEKACQPTMLEPCASGL